jgi:hypothetical protein
MKIVGLISAIIAVLLINLLLPDLETVGAAEEATAVTPNPTAQAMERKLTPLDTLPEFVTDGSIKIINPNADITDFAHLAQVSLDDAIGAARAALPETIAAIELTTSADFLVWKVTLVRDNKGAVLMIDAGSKRLLALQPLVPQHGSWW